MLTFLEDLFENYSDPRTKDWFLITSVWIPVTLLAIYFIFCTWLGPHLMKNREPFRITPFLNFYNVFVVILNGALTFYFMFYMVMLRYSPLCQPVATSGEMELMIAKGFYAYFISKIIEIVDTFVIIAKKKISANTLLHYYHHSSMIFITWMGVRFSPGGSSVILATVNGFFHFFMYLYYHMNSAKWKIGTLFQFKNMMMALQIVQFIVVILHCITASVKDCGYPQRVLMGLGAYVVTFLVMFTWFMYVPKSFSNRLWDCCARYETGKSRSNPGLEKSLSNRGLASSSSNRRSAQSPSGRGTSGRSGPLLLPAPETIPSKSFVRSSTQQTTPNQQTSRRSIEKTMVATPKNKILNSDHQAAETHKHKFLHWFKSVSHRKSISTESQNEMKNVQGTSSALVSNKNGRSVHSKTKYKTDIANNNSPKASKDLIQRKTHSRKVVQSGNQTSSFFVGSRDAKLKDRDHPAWDFFQNVHSKKSRRQ